MTGDQLTTAAALVELDGVARRIVLCPPGLHVKHLGAIVGDAKADGLLFDAVSPPPDFGIALRAPCSLPLKQYVAAERQIATEWLLLTSGTSGVPKIAVHTLFTLLAAIGSENAETAAANWATFYDIRRYGGLQIFLRSVVGGGSLTLRESTEPVEDFLIRAGGDKVTHISGTPSHWRFGLTNPTAARRIDPQYLRLSGEITDTSIYNALRSFYPRARLVDAYASTETGVGFEVSDGEPGFPEAFLNRMDSSVRLRVVQGTLRVRSNRTAVCLIGADAANFRDGDGFVDTGDMIECKGGRCYFVGRRGGVINVGGLKVSPEEVEAVINGHSGVRASLVKGKKSPLIGSVVVADIVLEDDVMESPALKRAIIETCAAALEAHKTPALLNFVSVLPVTPAGKMARN
jgi:acyl-coenzyme A synthetase/AMP-(fatty) acid ligase